MAQVSWGFEYDKMLLQVLDVAKGRTAISLTILVQSLLSGIHVLKKTLCLGLIF